MFPIPNKLRTIIPLVASASFAVASVAPAVSQAADSYASVPQAQIVRTVVVAPAAHCRYVNGRRICS